jgi:hypothetical protein
MQPVLMLLSMFTQPGAKPSREHFSRGEFASEIVDRLDYLCVTEVVTEKAMPFACLLWKGLGE